MAEQQIEHVRHEHPLMSKEEQKEEDCPLVFCSACEDPVLGPSYTCNQCRPAFVLHKSCADELLPERNHPIHRKHPLILFSATDGIFCKACGQRCRGFTYACSQCHFDIDLKCASKWQNHCQYHKFIVLKKHIKSFCNACGHSGEIFYLCSICELAVHKECAWLPRQVKIPLHQHRLELTWSFEDIYPKNNHFCDLCFKKLDDIKFDVYYCHECCSFVAHDTCTLKYAKIPDATTSESTHDNEPQHNNIQTNPEPAAQIDHFSHQHSLTLISYDHEVHKANDHHDDVINTCNGCRRPITATDAFYSCAGQEELASSCRFFLHIICAQLPQKRHLPLHRHQLTLLPRASSIDGVFMCYMCNRFS
ncbi:hypothetical protein ACE6H2_023773 [Prunus campanulata]